MRSMSGLGRRNQLILAVTGFVVLTMVRHDASLTKLLSIINISFGIVGRKSNVAPQPPAEPGAAERRLAKDVSERCIRGGQFAVQPSRAEADMLFTHMLYDDSKKLVFCYIAKVGCTNWKRVFAAMKSGNSSSLKIPHHKLHFRRNRHVSYLSDLNYLEALHRLQTYKKVMFVRDPATRLLAVYRDLIAWRPKNASDAFMQEMFFRDRSEWQTGRRIRPEDVNITLTSFLKMVLSRTRPHEMDEHWQTYTSNCMPCSVRYDYIGKHEELPDSADNVLQALGINNIRFPKKELDYTNNPVRRKSAKELYSRVSRTLLQSAWHRYGNDIELFGYSALDSYGTEDDSPDVEADTLADYLRRTRPL
ncbi:carbohydrate sulfotransferase 14-like [Sycon ciliatum]|uniref:carbohydrate sulfotransferase 14-like n=1 Tax=Sycon ciliatum TaxID=27933 RepID=UPI0031F72230